jgi:DNA-binding response OmpR family regulator
MKTILIVDDDEAVAEAVRFVIEKSGYGTKTAADAAEGRAAAGGADAALVDVFLDGDDGLALAGELARRMPVLVMSGGGPGRTLESVMAKADAIGAKAVLFKPFDDDELLAALAGALG